MTAWEGTHANDAITVGTRILQSMEGIAVPEYSFIRSAKAVTMDTECIILAQG